MLIQTEITIDSVSASRFHYEFTICFAISLWIHYLFREFTLNPLFPANSLWIHYLLCEFTMNSKSFSRLYFKFIILIENTLWTSYFLPAFTMNSLSFSGIYYEFTICFANFNEFTLFLELPMNLLFFFLREIMNWLSF